MPATFPPPSYTLGSTTLTINGVTSSVSGLTLSGTTFSGTTTLPGSGRISSAGSIGIGITPIYPIDVSGDPDGNWAGRIVSSTRGIGVLLGARSSTTGSIQAVNSVGATKGLNLSPDGGGVTIGSTLTDPGAGNLLVNGTGTFSGVINTTQLQGGSAGSQAVPGANQVQAYNSAGSAGVWAIAASGGQGSVGTYDKTSGHIGAYLYSNTAYAGIATVDNAGGFGAEVFQFRATSLVFNAGLTQYGGTTSSFPALKRSGTTLQVRLADDSADAPFSASNGVFSGTLSSNAITASVGTTQDGITLTGSGTTGAVFNLTNTDTGGHRWRFFSTGSVNGEGAGKLLFLDGTAGVSAMLLSSTNILNYLPTQFGGTTSSFPMLKRSGITLEHRLADDSDYAPVKASVGSFTGINGTIDVGSDNGDQIGFTKNGFNYITASGAGAVLRIQAIGTSGTVSLVANGHEAKIDNTGLFTTESISSSGTIKTGVYTVAGLPTAGTTGRRAWVSNATQALTAGIGAIVAGGGSNSVPVSDDGTNWRIG